LTGSFAVATDLAHIVGKSVVAAKRHRALGNVDLRLGLIMAIGTIAGAEMGAQLIQALKQPATSTSLSASSPSPSISAFRLSCSGKAGRRSPAQSCGTLGANQDRSERNPTNPHSST